MTQKEYRQTPPGVRKYCTLKQVNNLQTLSAYLKNGLKAQFTMRLYDDDGSTMGLYKRDCGTAGCAVGHGPYAGIVKLPSETWKQYTQRVFGSTESRSLNLNNASSFFRWIFSGGWEATDNTPVGAALRIDWFLEHGCPDEESIYDQMHGEVPLYYK